MLASGLAKLDVVPRAEFDVQAKVLARTREKLDELERKVAELESKRASRAERAADSRPRLQDARRRGARRRLAQFALQDLADRAHRQLGDQLEPLGQLERRDLLPRRKAISSSNVSVSPGCGTTQAHAFSPNTGSGMRDEHRGPDLRMQRGSGSRPPRS